MSSWCDSSSPTLVEGPCKVIHVLITTQLDYCNVVNIGLPLKILGNYTWLKMQCFYLYIRDTINI